MLNQKAQSAECLPAAIPRTRRAYTVTAGLGLGASLWLVATADLGDVSRHMATHILLMNVAGPLIAIWCIAPTVDRVLPAAALSSATFVQLVLLWGLHTPAAMASAHSSTALHLMMQVLLLGAAVLFWRAVIDEARHGWRAILALLITGKLFCLLGGLLTFAPRPIYIGAHAAHGAGQHEAALADQQLAGLMMLIACPATYVLAGVVVSIRWLDALSAEAR